MLARPPTIVDKALAAVDGEGRTVREIFATVDEGAAGSVRDALIRLAAAGRVDQRYDPHPTGRIARYRVLQADADATVVSR
jgi:hypothetical protein